MKIAVIGTGALGGFYAARLARSGQELHCLCRSDYETVRRDGLKIKSPEGDFQVPVHAHRETATIGVADLALIAVKTTSNADLPALLKPVLGPETLVLTLQNGLGNEEFLARLHPANRILGGVAFLCSNRIGPGYFHHIAHGHIHLAEFSGAAQPRTRQIAEIFQKAGIRCEARDSLREIRWRKLVWNIPFNGLSVGANFATVEDILADPDLRAAARALMLETIAAANAEGCGIPESFAEENFVYSEPMGPYKTSMQLDFEAKRPIEAEAILGEPLRRAERAGVNAPSMRMLYACAKRWDPGRK